MPEASGLGLDGRTWGNGPGDQPAVLTHLDANTLIVLEGSMRLMLPEGRRTLRLEVGDRVDLAPGTVHAAAVGEQGVTSGEAQRRAGWDGGRG